MYVSLDPDVIALAASCSGPSDHSSDEMEKYVRMATDTSAMYTVPLPDPPPACPYAWFPNWNPISL